MDCGCVKRKQAIECGAGCPEARDEACISGCVENPPRHVHKFGGKMKNKCRVCGLFFLTSEIDGMREGVDFIWVDR